MGKEENPFACYRAVYMVLRVVLVRLHGGSLHPHQPLRQTDEEWSAQGEAQHTHSGELCKHGVVGSVELYDTESMSQCSL